MSQLGNSVATASPFNTVYGIVIDSANDVSVFELPTSVGSLIQVDIHWLTHPNWQTGISGIHWEILDNTGVQVFSSTSTSDDLTLTYITATSGVHYLRLTTTDNDAATVRVISKSFNDDSIAGHDTSFVRDSGAFILRVADILANNIMQDQSMAIWQGIPENPGVPNEFFYAGSGVISGNLQVNDVYSQRKVHLYAKSEGILLASTWSDPITGYFEFKGYATEAELTGAKYFVTGHDYKNEFPSDIADNLVAIAP